MGTLIKCDPDTDRYVYWSDIAEGPHVHGDRVAVGRYLRHIGDDDGLDARFARADALGTSSLPGFHDWDTRSLIVEQRGLLARKDLWAFCEAYFGDPKRRDECLDLLVPFGDCDHNDSCDPPCRGRAVYRG